MGFGVEKWYLWEKDPILGRRCPTSGRKVVSWKAVFVFWGGKWYVAGETIVWFGGEQYSVAENAMFLGDKRVYLRRRRRAFGEKHRIRTQKTEWPGLKRTSRTTEFQRRRLSAQGRQPVDRAAQSHTQPGLQCLQGDEASPASLGSRFQCVTPLGVKNVFVLSHLNAPCLSSSPVSNRSPS